MTPVNLYDCKPNCNSQESHLNLPANKGKAMLLTIKNSAELSAWIKERMALNHDMAAIKGPAPAGSTYEDGTPIVHPVNIQWRDCVTGEVFEIDYSKEQSNETTN